MGFSRRLEQAFWQSAPAKLFHPREGEQTTEGMILREAPLLTDPPETKFAVFSDMRFYMRKHYRKLLPFLPREFEVIGEPNGQNCFMYALDIPKSRKEFGRERFDAELARRNYVCTPYLDIEPVKDDIVVYSIADMIDSFRTHAAKFVGGDRVRSRWGKNSPLIEHPLEEVVPNYWDGNHFLLSVERKSA